jgi:hypothetical protein
MPRRANRTSWVGRGEYMIGLRLYVPERYRAYLQEISLHLTKGTKFNMSMALIWLVDEERKHTRAGALDEPDQASS